MKDDAKLKRIQVVSFGFKYGPPPEANLVEDVRWVTNPFYEPSLRELTGADRAVQEFILSQPGVVEFLSDMRNSLHRRLRGWLDYGNDHEQVTLAFGCTGGKHRSRFFALTCAAMATEIVAALGIKSHVSVSHRDEGKE